MLTRVLLLLVLSFAAVSVYASDMCNTLACQHRKVPENTRLEMAQQSPPLYIARDTNYNVLYMNQGKAIQYCANQGMRLPSARDLAKYSESMGAAGISETAKDGYYLVRAKNVDGKIDIFYFSAAGFLTPEGDLGNQWFWTSSTFLDDPYYAVFFGTDHGGIDYVSGEYRDLAVLCAADHG